MNIQLFRPHYEVEDCLNEIRTSLQTGWTGYGPKSIQFEKEWCEFTGLPHAHFLNSNTSGLHLALRILKQSERWSEKSEIITTPLTFVATNQTILYENLTPVFADIDSYLCLDPSSVKRLINCNTRALIFVGIGGNFGQFDEIVDICRNNGIILILDAAHMAGSRFNGRHAGFGADVTVFSFQSVKNLPTADSGMICFSNQELDKYARKLSWMGIDKTTFERANSDKPYNNNYRVEEIGFKYHGNDIMASIALVQLQNLNSGNAERRRIAADYSEQLTDVEGIKVIQSAPSCQSSQHLFQIRVKNRDSLISFLNKKGISTGIHYHNNLDYSIFSSFEKHADATHSREICREILSLPLFLGMSSSQVIEICDQVKNWRKCFHSPQ
ncbi:MAG: DegT/DnrJ/EryC1/StrS family aminotransferase [Candidatus Riflebacteria bacterium]|nr:DegT/DnrJ/EryC1/StrS family aminotransferase [Candidatus Riflebacteria bacterium]